MSYDNCFSYLPLCVISPSRSGNAGVRAEIRAEHQRAALRSAPGQGKDDLLERYVVCLACFHEAK